jgi:hypothetical protein
MAMRKYDVARRYAIYCDTDAKWVDGYSVDVPNTCYDNVAHTVSTTKNPRLLVESAESIQYDTTSTGTSIMNFTKLETLRIRDDLLPIGDFRLRHNRVSAMRYVSPAHPSVMFGMHTMTSPEQGDDYINLYVGYQSLLGVLQASLVVGDSVIQVYNNPVNSIASIYTGYEVMLNTGYVHQVTTITTTGAFATLTNGQYLVIYCANNYSAYYVWFDTTGDHTTGNPNLANKTGLVANVSTATSDGDVAAAIAAALLTMQRFTEFTTSVSGNVVTVTNTRTGPSTTPTTTMTNVAIAVTSAGALGDIESLGDVTDVNTSLMKIRTERRTTKAYAAYTTRVLVHRHVVRNLHMGNIGGPHTYGEFQQGSMFFPPNTQCLVTYTNTHTEDCFLYVDIEWGEGSQNLGTIAS